VVDTSAWARQHAEPVVERFRATLDADLLAGCPVVALELLSVARSEAEWDAYDRALRAIPQAPVTVSACAAALAATREVVVGGARRRVPAADYLIGAAAAERGFGVLHYDRDYDALSGPLGFESVWLARPGSIP
jgi:predicted nucleic acid-binding protein